MSNMKCPYCDNETTKVIDSRDSDNKVRRRRECIKCERRFTTYEVAQKLDIKVEKRDGEVENFDKEKIRNGMERAVEKTDITQEEVDEAVENVRKHVRTHERIKAEEIGEAVKEELKKLDEVAYIRFASVYESFDDAESFQKEVEALKEVEK